MNRIQYKKTALLFVLAAFLNAGPVIAGGLGLEGDLETDTNSVPFLHKVFPFAQTQSEKDISVLKKINQADPTIFDHLITHEEAPRHFQAVLVASRSKDSGENKRGKKALDKSARDFSDPHQVLAAAHLFDDRIDTNLHQSTLESVARDGKKDHPNRNVAIIALLRNPSTAEEARTYASGYIIQSAEKERENGEGRGDKQGAVLRREKAKTLIAFLEKSKDPENRALAKTLKEEHAKYLKIGLREKVADKVKEKFSKDKSSK